jgi:hypothetical protein
MPSQTKVADLLDTVADANAFQDLLAVVRSRSALALVGAGFSQRVGYPSWDKLLNEMADRLDAERARHGGNTKNGNGNGNHPVTAAHPVPELLRRHEDFLWRAEELRQRLDEEAYRDFLRERFAPRMEEDVCLDRLVRLPFRHLLTTNYDDSIERAYRRAHGKDIDVVVWDDGTNARQMMYDLLRTDLSRRLVYLHGRMGEEVNVVLTDRDYAERYLRNDSTVRKLFAIFAMQRLVMFGFSLRDPDLSAIMRQVAGALGYDRTRHFAFVGLKVGDGETPGEDREIERRRFRQKYGVEAIFYDGANSHLLLKVLMEHMLAVCEGRARPSGGTRVIHEAAESAPVPEFADITISDADSVVVERNIADTNRLNRMNPRIPDDPRKGMFGGSPVDATTGRQLSAVVLPSGTSKTLFSVHLEVKATPGAPELADVVVFYLHNTFRPSEVAVEVVHGKAVLNLVAYGAFTVGAITADGAELELDLVTIDAPARFLEN